MSSKLVSFVRSHAVFAVLLACHLPMVALYYRSLWNQTHYQFFPFAIGAFIWLFATRKSSDPTKWGWPSRLLIGFDLVCIAAGAWLFSPWLFAVGLFALLTALCWASRDAGYRRRLVYLASLPLLTLRLPMQYDEQVIHGLQRITTDVASRTLHRAGFLHYREGNVLQFPGKSFLVEEACSGVQSVFTILFIAALVICLKRRSMVHGALLLAVGVIVAGIMNSIRVISIAVAWSSYNTDWSTGLSHDILGYVCLAAAAALLLSADAFLGFLSDVVPDVRRPGAVSLYFNPLISLWNRFVSVVPELSGRQARRDINSDSQRQNDAHLPDAERREHPAFRDAVKPANVFHFALGWAESWLFSRDYRQLVSGVPFALLAGTAILLVWQLRHAPVDQIIADLENAFNSAVADQDLQRQETALRALGSLRTTEPAYRFRLAQFMIQQGRTNEGLNEILSLTPEAALGYADARLWLVNQSLQREPMLKLSLDEIEKQLTKVIDQQPTNTEARRLLSQVYTDRKEWKLAEHHLTEAARLEPEHNLALAKLMRYLKRSDEAVSAVAQKAIDHFTTRLEKNRTDPEVRILLADGLLIAEKESEAREILVSGLQQKDDPRLRKALSDFDLMVADRRLSESGLNRDACIPVVMQALQRDPSNVAAVQLLAKLRDMGVKVPADALKAAVDHWEAVIAEDANSAGPRTVLSQLLTSSSQPARAAEVLEPVVESRPELRLTLATLFLECGRTDDANAILNTLKEEAQRKLAATPEDKTANISYCQALILSGDPEAARLHLASLANDEGASQIPSSPELASLYGRACIACFDKLTGFSADPATGIATLLQSSPQAGESEVLLNLLADAFECQGTTNQAIDRLSRLSLSSHPAAAEADGMLRRLRLDGTHASQVLNLLGMHALLMNRFDKATPWLEQANLQARGRDPMILNNLATAIVRGGTDSKERALQLANETLLLIPDHPDALSTRGEIYVALEKWPEAIADLTQSLKLRQDSSELHRLLEKAYSGMNDSQMAEEHRRRAEAIETSKAPAS